MANTSSTAETGFDVQAVRFLLGDSPETQFAYFLQQAILIPLEAEQKLVLTPEEIQQRSKQLNFNAVDTALALSERTTNFPAFGLLATLYWIQLYGSRPASGGNPIDSDGRQDLYHRRAVASLTFSKNEGVNVVDTLSYPQIKQRAALHIATAPDSLGTLGFIEYARARGRTDTTTIIQDQVSSPNEEHWRNGITAKVESDRRKNKGYDPEISSVTGATYSGVIPHESKRRRKVIWPTELKMYTPAASIVIRPNEDTYDVRPFAQMGIENLHIGTANFPAAGYSQVVFDAKGRVDQRKSETTVVTTAPWPAHEEVRTSRTFRVTSTSNGLQHDASITLPILPSHVPRNEVGEKDEDLADFLRQYYNALVHALTINESTQQLSAGKRSR